MKHVNVFQSLIDIFFAMKNFVENFNIFVAAKQMCIVHQLFDQLLLPIMYKMFIKYDLLP